MMRYNGEILMKDLYENEAIKICEKIRYEKNICAIYILIGLVSFTIFLFFLPHNLGSINDLSEEYQSGAVYMTFIANVGDKIKIAYNTVTDEGVCILALFDSTGKRVCDLDKSNSKNINKFVVLDKDGIYTLEAKYRNFKGSFDADVYRVK